MKGKVYIKPYILDYAPPTETVRKCEKCKNNLGAQNPGWICDMCKHTKGK